MTTLPRLIGYQVINVTTGDPTRGETEILSEACAIRELLTLRDKGNPYMWVMSAILEGDLDDLIGEAGPIVFIDE